MESVALWGECGEFSIPARVWLGILSVARHYGWEARGTLPSEFDIGDDGTPESFDGCYHPPCLQRIQVEDVVALANALEHMLTDGRVSNVIELHGPNKFYVRPFVAHCREGGELWIG